MTDNWKETTFGKCALLLREGVNPQDAEGMPYIGLEHIQQNALCLNGYGYAEDVTSAKARFKKGDILFGKLRPYFRKVIVAPFDGVCSTDIWVVRSTEGVDQRFLYYWMASEEFVNAASQASEGTKMPRAKWEYVCKIVKPIPPLSEQKAIAHILGTLDDKIELNQRMNEALEQIARAIFKSWFIDFEFPNEQGKPYKSSGGEMIDSELGKVPNGWTGGALKDLVGFLAGYAFKSKDWIDDGIPVVKIGSVKPGIVDLDQVSFVSQEVAHESRQFRLNPGDLLIGMTGYVGEVGLVPPTDNPPLLNQRVGKFLLEEGTGSLAYIYCLTRRSDFKMEVEAKSHGTAQANVSTEGILSISTVIPTVSIRRVFNLMCQPLFDRILSNYAQSRTLAALRDTLLPKLLSGEIRVNDAEKFVNYNL